MPSKMYNRARMTVTSTGTGALSLGIAVAGYQTFSSAGAQNNDTVSYTIEDGLNWEIGTGTFNATSGTLSRTVTQSYNGTSYGTTAISVTTNAQVYITALAADIVVTDGPLGTPSSATLTNATGLPVATGLSGLGTGVATALAVNTGSAGSVVVNGGALGTPSSGTLTNATGLPVATGISGLGTGVATALAVNTGSSGAFVTNGGALGTPASGNLSNCTFPTLNQNTTGTASNVTGTVGVANGGTGLTSLTAGRIPYGAGTGAFGNSANLFWDAANSRLGVGTASPSYRLDVRGNVQVVATGAAIAILDSSTFDYLNISNTGFDTYLANNAAAPFILKTGGVERMRLDASGNLGLGVTPSAWASSRRAIQIGNSTVASLGLSSGIGEILYNTFFDGSNFKYVTSNYAASFDYNNAVAGGFAWRLAASGSAGGTISFTQAMTLDASGNLGIGTSSPGFKLDVVTTGGPIAKFEKSSGTNGFIYLLDTVRSFALFANNGAFGVFDNTAGTERMRIDSSGRLLVGATSMSNPSSVGGSPRLGVAIAGQSSVAMFTGYGDGFGFGIVCQLNASSSGNAGNHIQFHDATGALSGFIRSSGTTTTFGTTSDIKLKTNILPASSALASILALPIRQFDWKSDGSHTDYGMVAQEAYDFVPEMVTQGETWAVDYGRAAPRLIKAFQELAAKVTALEEHLNG